MAFIDASDYCIWADLSISLIFLQLKEHSSAIDIFLSEVDKSEKQKRILKLSVLEF